MHVVRLHARSLQHTLTSIEEQWEGDLRFPVAWAKAHMPFMSNGTYETDQEKTPEHMRSAAYSEWVVRIAQALITLISRQVWNDI